MMRYLALSLLLVVCAGCTRGDVFTDLGTNIASPSSMAIDVASNRLYLVNSNNQVLYDPTQGSFQVYNIASPLAPVLMNTLQTMSDSGEVYLDPVTKRLYTPNRYTANESIKQSNLYNIVVDEASVNFLSETTTSLGQDSYAIKCCYPANRAWITTRNNEIDYVDLGGSLTPGTISLISPSDNGGTISNAPTDHIAIIGNQAFLTLEPGGIAVVNLDEAGVAGAVPVDYFIQNVDNPMGITTDGTLLYVAGQGDVNGWKQLLYILNPAALTPTTTNTTTHVVQKEDSGILVSTIEVGDNPQEVLLSTAYAFVTNMDDNTVSVINLATRTVTATIKVGKMPFSLGLYKTLAGVDQYVYVGNLESNNLSIIDIPTLTVVATYP